MSSLRISSSVFSSSSEIRFESWLCSFPVFIFSLRLGEEMDLIVQFIRVSRALGSHSQAMRSDYGRLVAPLRQVAPSRGPSFVRDAGTFRERVRGRRRGRNEAF